MHTWKKIGVHLFLKNGFGVKGLALTDKRGRQVTCMVYCQTSGLGEFTIGRHGL
jgi:hypothetical protein